MSEVPLYQRPLIRLLTLIKHLICIYPPPTRARWTRRSSGIQWPSARKLPRCNRALRTRRRRCTSQTPRPFTIRLGPDAGGAAVREYLQEMQTPPPPPTLLVRVWGCGLAKNGARAETTGLPPEDCRAAISGARPGVEDSPSQVRVPRA